MTNKNTSNEIQNVLIKSLITGYILKNILILFPIRFNLYLDTIGLLIFSLISSYAISLFTECKLSKIIMKKLGIRRTINKNIWDDIRDKKETLWVKIMSKELDLVYYGILVLIEESERQPQIVLSHYLKQTVSGEIIVDNSNVSEQRIVIDISKFEFVELVYNPKSENIKEVKKKTDEFQNNSQ